jgi:AAHS family 4-hydroxybenzoate transporter-like MFS transporter
MATPAQVNVSDIIDRSKVTGFHVGVFVLCGLCLIMDGFDVQAIGYVAPALSRDWHITGALLGSVLSAALMGVLFGSILFSMAADRLGRRPLLIAACLFFAVVTLATSRVDNVTQLMVLRFIAGLALGSIMPNAISLVGEYSPRSVRVLNMIVVGTGFTLGAAIGGFVSFWLIPHFGWRSVFVFGGSIPLGIGVLMYFLLPESIQFLVLHDKDRATIGKWLKRVDPSVSIGAGTEFLVRERRLKGLPIVKLFQEGRAARTLLQWLVYFMNLLNLYFLSSWLPTVAGPLVKAAGASANVAVLLGSALQIGGVFGAFFLGWLVLRLGFVPVLASCFALASLNIALIGQPGLSLVTLFVVVFLTGLGVVGGQSSMNAFVGTLYPTDLRSTGIGSGLGVGRIGSIVGPIVAGELISLHWAPRQLFLAAAVPAVISVVGMIAMHWAVEPQEVHASESKVMVH